MMKQYTERQIKAARKLDKQIHRAARKANKAGLSMGMICGVFEAKASWARYIHAHGAIEYPKVKSEPKKRQTAA